MSSKILLFFVVILLLLVLVTGGYAWFLYNQKESLSASLALTKKTQVDMKADAQRITEENANLQKQLDKIQTDALTYVATNTKLQLEKEGLEKRINDIQEEIRKKETLLSGVKTPSEQVQNREVANLQQELAKLKAESKAFNATLKGTEVEINLLNESSRREKAVLYYNLGVAFTEAKAYDQAVSAYEKSLRYNPLNPQAHYNLGLIYENIKLNYPKAVWHYRLYLEQSPQAQDTEEVMGWIKKLR